MHRVAFIATFTVAFLIGLIIREGVSSPVGQLPDGGDYSGPLLNGRLQGPGEIRWPDGRHYRGEFEQGLYHGRGVFTYAAGSRYEGQFVRGNPEGQGTLKYHNGDQYVGQFKDGKLHGHGRFTRKRQIYEGDFVNDEFSGQGSLTVDGEFQYSGSFKDWTFNGEGQYFSGDGESWKGTFVDGNLKGPGEYSDGEGNRYVGAFEFWQYQGKGIFYDRDNSRYEGEFQYGQFHGKGVMHLPEPQHGVLSYSGQWRNGTLISADVPAFVEHTAEKLEQALYTEAPRLEQQLQQVQAGVPGVTELYYLGVAGDGSQRVFGREIDFVTQQLQQRYPLDGHSVTLINDRFRVGDASMATRVSLEKAVQALAAKMNADEDVLLLYLTSHGSADHRFSLHQNGLRLPDLDAPTLAEILKKSGIRYQILMVSACYSGGFVPVLKRKDRLVMTAAAADRTSFGCSDESDMTYFGRAYFKEAFPTQPDWIKAFEQARQWIERTEKEEKKTPSQPQIAVGRDIEAKLTQLRRREG
ncbi:MAG TPA: C13 family peptidase [Dongiaceae bacterium]|nr:C13 family peptidase [Dongiaceae bacterium]